MRTASRRPARTLTHAVPTTRHTLPSRVAARCAPSSALSGPPTSHHARAMSERPDLLLFVSDQHSARLMNCAGETVLDTPSLDALATDGTRFSAATTPCPLCVPARHALMTGQLPSRTGVYTNSNIARCDLATFAHSLTAAGYQSVLCGRMHFTGLDQRRGFERRLVGDFTPCLDGRGGAARDDLGPYVPRSAIPARTATPSPRHRCAPRSNAIGTHRPCAPSSSAAAPTNATSRPGAPWCRGRTANAGRYPNRAGPCPRAEVRRGWQPPAAARAPGARSPVVGYSPCSWSTARASKLTVVVRPVLIHNSCSKVRPAYSARRT